MGKVVAFVAWVGATGLVATGVGIALIRANNSAVPGSTAAKIFKKVS